MWLLRVEWAGVFLQEEYIHPKTPQRVAIVEISTPTATRIRDLGIAHQFASYYMDPEMDILLYRRILKWIEEDRHLV